MLHKNSFIRAVYWFNDTVTIIFLIESKNDLPYALPALYSEAKDTKVETLDSMHEMKCEVCLQSRQQSRRRLKGRNVQKVKQNNMFIEVISKNYKYIENHPVLSKLSNMVAGSKRLPNLGKNLSPTVQKPVQDRGEGGDGADRDNSWVGGARPGHCRGRRTLT